jgi:mono/diheme cytochrome c family protein
MIRRTVAVNILGFGALTSALLFTSACGHPPVAEGDDPSSTLDFAKLYSQNCAGCHGADGTHGPGPRIGDPLYLAFAKREAIRDVLEHGRKGTAMPAFGPSESGPLSGKQLDALVDGLEKKWGNKPDTGAPPLPPYSEQDSIQAGGEPGDAARGQQAYLRNCAFCHGFGPSPSPFGPVATPSYVAIASDQGLRTTIVVGRPDFGMPDWRHRPPRAMANQDISDVVAWLASLRPAYSKLKPMAIVPTNLQEQKP